MIEAKKISFSKSTPIKSSSKTMRRTNERSRSPITRSMKRSISPTPESRNIMKRLLSPIIRIDHSFIHVKKSPIKSAMKSPMKTNSKKIKLFTVSEDSTIIKLLKKNPETKICKIASKLNRPLKFVEHRINRYLCKLSDEDIEKILITAKLTPSWHAHFIPNGEGGKTIGKILKGMNDFKTNAKFVKVKNNKNLVKRVTSLFI